MHTALSNFTIKVWTRVVRVELETELGRYENINNTCLLESCSGSTDGATGKHLKTFFHLVLYTLNV